MKIRRRFTPLEACHKIIFRKRRVLRRRRPLTGFTIKKREQARTFVENRISYFNKFYNFNINRIAIKNASTRWGSCSSKGNLNFNYKIIYLRPELADYLIVHELCHLGQLNHSGRFKALVSKTIPDYVKINKELKRTNVKFI
ncbi:MAG: M48 family metallopeptidase [Candidatus Staskawiczbacteria bacterium]|nr:M48 family metallopeptidase [Candidatus Staskawiczbacteria bacterium]